MKIFDTKVQYLKYEALKEVAKESWAGTLYDNMLDIPSRIITGTKPTMRCCVYKERAIFSERVKAAVGKGKSSNIVEVISIACDECPIGGYEITNACRGCLAHRCADVCKRDAIYFDENHVAKIDKTKCVECGMCAKVCPYSAIHNYKRPCEVACKINAISMDENHCAKIDDERCTSCGACVYQCPFGAITDKSYIVDVIDIIKKSNNNRKYKVYAIVAPSISSQFTYAKLGQVITGLKKLGFYTVIEAALGADMVANDETKELVEKGFLINSCCPSFVKFIKNDYPQLYKYVSSNLSPMAKISKYIKEIEPNSKIVFIGPCTSKKMEIKEDTVKDYVDSVLTFEELQALFDSKDMEIESLEEDILDNASYYGRIFARSGGLSEAIKEGLKENNISDFELKPAVCDGIEACKLALLKKNKNFLDANFIEGMACTGGCIAGAGCLTHGEKNKAEVDKYGREAYEKTIHEAISVLKVNK